MSGDSQVNSGSSVVKPNSGKGKAGRSGGASGRSSGVGVETGVAAVDVQVGNMVVGLPPRGVRRSATASCSHEGLTVVRICAFCKLVDFRFYKA